ncbi:MAG TPA: M14 metallopeptidase family protein [Pyrinomonadaceae bacterium]|nr:M14 metallopeptidase family protein [Pyrinomonadaceae bacterium]
MRAKIPVLLLLLVSAFARPAQPIRPASAANIPMPSEVLGFTPGDDRKLASWSQVVNYFEQLDRASDRVIFETLGQTTMGNPFVMATISSPANLARLEEYKQIQAQLADPRQIGTPAIRDRKAAELIRRGKTIVLITCGIHSTEVGSYLSSMLIAHRLASSNEPEIQKILDNTIILLVPSLNPDGVDIVKGWYDKTLGTPYEGTDPPELYHKYTGHDNNRDWYAFTQVETQITVDKIHNVWHPQIVHDIHQQGAMGSRLFLPPYMAPVEPNVPRQIVEGYTQLGAWMAQQMRAKGFQGITTNSTYDAWTPSRAYSHYHGGVRILSETASARIASPITLKFEELTSREGYDPQKESANFGPLWRGGEWRLRDITNYMTTGAFLLLQHAAENRVQWLQRFYEIGKEAVRPPRAGELWGYEITGRGRSYLMLEYALKKASVEVDNCETPQNEAAKFVALAQPYGSFAKALLELQRYPDLRDSSGHPIAPYDVTAHSLFLLTGAQVRPVTAPFRCKTVEWRERGLPAYHLNKRVALYRSSVPAIDEGWTRFVLEQNSGPVASLRDPDLRAGNLIEKFDTIVLPDQAPRTILNGYRLGSMPPLLTGGIGTEGVKALREFVTAGGTLVLLNRACDFAIEHFGLPVRDVVAGLPKTEFYVPGSILRIELNMSHPIARGMPYQTLAWAEDSPVFEVVYRDMVTEVPASDVTVIASYPRTASPLLSGWLLGANRMRNKAALLEVKFGKGQLVLFGFRPQYRAQSLATYPLFFNALNR